MSAFNRGIARLFVEVGTADVVWDATLRLTFGPRSRYDAYSIGWDAMHDGLSQDAHRVAAIADEELAAWNEFIHPRAAGEEHQ